uniref:Ribosomal RNA methyltransferase FtsJ domain-containing protein n=1 Tax=Mycena chlorophos TaxID=658473 RepID=A0ABQ0LFH1_MYCCL|nr:predicted protein [Mycena chlorophos]
MNETVALKNQTLRKLNRLRYQGGHSPAAEAHRDFQRRQADSQDPTLQHAWLKSMKKVLEEIDDVLKVVPTKSPIRFLDLGCCPGGFTSYILAKNPNARGAGISLPVENGGHACLLSQTQLDRFDLHWADMTRFQLGAVLIDDPALQDLPIEPENFDLVLIDGHPLRTSDSPRLSKAFDLLSDRLLISQLLIGLAAARMGSTIILKASKPERLVTSQLMFLMDLLCADVRTWKPVCIHSTRDTFYVVGKGFGLRRSPDFMGHKARVMAGLMDLWVQLSYHNGQGRRLNSHDLDFIVDAATLKEVYAPRLQQLSEHIWVAQSQSLQGWQAAQASGF